MGMILGYTNQFESTHFKFKPIYNHPKTLTMSRQFNVMTSAANRLESVRRRAKRTKRRMMQFKQMESQIRYCNGWPASYLNRIDLHSIPESTVSPRDSMDERSSALSVERFDELIQFLDSVTA